MKVLVTGATGFIGNFVIKALLKKGVEVIASSSTTEHASGFEWYKHNRFFELDLSALSPNFNYFEYFQRPDKVIHLAWEGLPNYTSSFHEEINLPRHKLFLTNLISNGLLSLTVTGTCLEYGMKEGKLSEDLEATPTNSYSRAKNELYNYLQSLQSSFAFNLKWVRLFYMYGKGQNPNSLLSQLERAVAEGKEVFHMSGGQQSRDYLPVEKVAEYIVSIALQEKITGVINCCSGIPVTVEMFVRNYLKERNLTIKLDLGYYPYNSYEPMNFWGDTDKLNKIVNNYD